MWYTENVKSKQISLQLASLTIYLELFLLIFFFSVGLYSVIHESSLFSNILHISECPVWLKGCKCQSVPWNTHTVLSMVLGERIHTKAVCKMVAQLCLIQMEYKRIAGETENLCSKHEMHVHSIWLLLNSTPLEMSICTFSKRTKEH